MSGSKRRFLLICAAVIVSGSCIHALFGASNRDWFGHAWGSDDAYISFRYALNMVRGEGLVFNTGERVEGYTNLLYVLLIAPFCLITTEYIYVVSVVLNTLFLIAAAATFFRYSAVRFGERGACVGTLMFSLSPVLWLWASAGLETILVLLIQILIWTCTDELRDSDSRRKLLTLAVAVAISAIVRADGFVFPLMAIGWLVLNGRIRQAAVVGAVLLVVLGGYFWWRFEYYGYLFPNTYYAKVAGPLGVRTADAFKQIAGHIIHQAYYLYFVPLILVCGVHGMLRSRSLSVAHIPSEVVFAAGWVAYFVYVGGDTHHERFLTTLVPLGICAVVRFGATRPLVLKVVSVLMLLQLQVFVTDSRFNYRFEKRDRWITLGRHLGQAHPGATLAVDAAGKLSYYSQLPIIDMLGLANEHIAHLDQTSSKAAGHKKFDPEYILERQPDLIAAWGHPDIGLAYGLSKAKYEQASYRLKYMVLGPVFPGEPIVVDVEGATEQHIRELYAGGYQYFVVQKR